MNQQEMSQVAVFTMEVLMQMKTFTDWLKGLFNDMLKPHADRLEALEARLAAEAAPGAGETDPELLMKLINEQLQSVRDDMKRTASDVGRTLAEDPEFIGRISRNIGEAKTEYEKDLHGKIAESLLRILNRDRGEKERLTATDIPPAYAKIIRNTGINRLNPTYMGEAEFDAAVTERNEAVVTELADRVRPLLMKTNQAKTETVARFVFLNTEDTELAEPSIRAAAKGSPFEKWFLK